jgi:hypothetical protein
LLGEIKKRNASYEEQLWGISERIRNRSNIEFSSAEVLQFFHLMERGTTRVDASRFNGDDADRFLMALEYQDALVELFEGYLWGLFKINHAFIVPRWLAVLPLAIYLTALKRAGRKWRVKELTSEQISTMHTYFLLAQFCDWNTQTMVNTFAKFAAREEADNSPATGCARFVGNDPSLLWPFVWPRGNAYPNLQSRLPILQATR